MYVCVYIYVCVCVCVCVCVRVCVCERTYLLSSRFTRVITFYKRDVRFSSEAEYICYVKLNQSERLGLQCTNEEVCFVSGL